MIEGIIPYPLKDGERVIAGVLTTHAQRLSIPRFALLSGLKRAAGKNYEGLRVLGFNVGPGDKTVPDVYTLVGTPKKPSQ